MRFHLPFVAEDAYVGAGVKLAVASVESALEGVAICFEAPATSVEGGGSLADSTAGLSAAIAEGDCNGDVGLDGMMDPCP